MVLILRECTKNWTKCKIRRVLSDLDFFCCSNGILAWLLIVPMIKIIHNEMIVLVMIESIFSIVHIRKCHRTSVLLHGTKSCNWMRVGRIFPSTMEKVRGHRVLPFMHP